MRKKIPAPLRREVTKRAGGFCEYCLSDSDFSDSPFDVEHIVPLSKNGETKIENLAFSCRGCNLYKSNKTEGFDIVGESVSRLFNPRK
jgi:5-methylcytosine-specific restriction endonuclease McrA